VPGSKPKPTHPRPNTLSPWPDLCCAALVIAVPGRPRRSGTRYCTNSVQSSAVSSASRRRHQTSIYFLGMSLFFIWPQCCISPALEKIRGIVTSLLQDGSTLSFICVDSM
jgi:hypothetical protein